MPKLSHEVMEERRARIEEAARELFIKRGFHATSMRDIAAGADASLGNLYNYYRTKEDILESIIARYQKVIDARLRAIFDESLFAYDRIWAAGGDGNTLFEVDARELAERIGARPLDVAESPTTSRAQA